MYVSGAHRDQHSFPTRRSSDLAVTNGAIFDITGGLITTVGLLFAGITLGIKRNKILRRFREEINHTRSKIEAELTLKLEEYVREIREKIEGQFKEFDSLLVKEKNDLEFMQKNHDYIAQETQKIKREIKKSG